MEALKALDPADREAHLETMKRPELQKLAKEAGLKVSSFARAARLHAAAHCGISYFTANTYSVKEPRGWYRLRPPSC